MPPTTSAEVFGPVHSGSFHLGPVDFEETMWTNACSPYPPAVRSLAGAFLGGIDNSLGADGSLCDACALVTTGLGKSVVVRLVTYGVSKAPGDMDLSPAAFQALDGMDPAATPSNPRPMTWQLAKCPDTGKLRLQYQTQANPWWTSLWVRNARLPIDRVEVQGGHHANFFALRRETDGTWNDDSGFGEGPFTLKLTARDGRSLTQRFERFESGALVETTLQFD